MVVRFVPDSTVEKTLVQMAAHDQIIVRPKIDDMTGIENENSIRKV